MEDEDCQEIQKKEKKKKKEVKKRRALHRYMSLFVFVKANCLQFKLYLQLYKYTLTDTTNTEISASA